jgi:phage gp45-like
MRHVDTATSLALGSCKPAVTRAGSRGANVCVVVRGGRRSACHIASRRHGFARGRSCVAAHRGTRAHLSQHRSRK